MQRIIAKTKSNKETQKVESSSQSTKKDEFKSTRQGRTFFNPDLPEVLAFVNNTDEIKKKDTNTCCISNLKEFIIKLKTKVNENCKSSIEYKIR